MFIPELDYDELASLYSGYFEDYVREIIPGESDEKVEGEDDPVGEEKEEDIALESAEGDHTRERVRTEPFLDLSIPVAEGTRYVL